MALCARWKICEAKLENLGKNGKSFNPERSQKFGFPDWFSLNLIFNPPVNSGFPQNFLDFFSGKPGKLFETKKELPSLTYDK